MKDDKLERKISELTHQIEKLTSFRESFLRGVITGVGTAIGATIIAGILIALLDQVITSASDVPVLNNLIQTVNLEEVVDDEN